MAKKSKAFVLCLLVLSCGVVQANVDRVDQYQFGYSYRPKKSFRKIIREVINKKEKRIPLPKIETVPVPWYDSVDDDLYKNLA
jgi:hypothetical protein